MYHLYMIVSVRSSELRVTWTNVHRVGPFFLYLAIQTNLTNPFYVVQVISSLDNR